MKSTLAGSITDENLISKTRVWCLINWFEIFFKRVFLQNGVTGGSELKLERVMKCPQQLQGNEWQITAEDHCGHGVNASFYHCVQEQVSGYVQLCIQPIVVRKEGAPFKKTEDNVQLLTSIDDLMALGIQSAVGKILAYDSSGTGFLVNQKYVFTAFHVVDEVFFHLWKQILNVLINCETNFNDDLWRDINKAKNIEDFEHKKDKVLKCLEDVTIPKVIQEAQQKFRDTRDEHVIVRLNQIVNDFKRRVETEEGGHKFKIVFNVLSESDGTGRGHFFSLDTPFVSVKEDVIILQLQDPSEVTSKPLLLNVDDSSSHETFDIYGYPDSSGLKVDRNCFKFTGSIGEFCKKAKEYFKGLRGINEDHIKLRDYTLNPQNHYIHCSPTMAHGTSGAPCIIYQNINGSIYPTVVGIYTCGYPRFAYYNNVWKDLQNSENKEFFKHLIEGGSTMKNCLELIRTRDSDLHRDLAPPATPHDLYISHELPIINMLTDKEIKEGDSYTIACVIRGTYGSFSWTFASVNDSDIYQEITNTENIEKVGTGLKLREVTCEMEGYYNCTVRFCGHEIKRDIYLKDGDITQHCRNTNDKQTESLTQHRRNTKAKQTETLTQHCRNTKDKQTESLTQHRRNTKDKQTETLTQHCRHTKDKQTETLTQHRRTTKDKQTETLT
ncbi:hypothetical protein FSP39_008996 [Pinctada imbricata]|uniref:Ig-like domain-containing protein n=1 Tax=Pinctada imbricata TaxID=66713 RepID=A0AA89BM32_PINIB|nr:hypothetical protein FSP39_008996 [Pinctada imbricata]